jgi:DNA-directed RNA polymerase alpha subunit
VTVITPIIIETCENGYLVYERNRTDILFQNLHVFNNIRGVINYVEKYFSISGEQVDFSIITIEELDLPSRLYHALMRHNIDTISKAKELLDENRIDYRYERGIGTKGIRDLRNAMRDKGYYV